MTRLGPWRPSTVEDRLDRLESLAEIQQLPVRYALALDSRNIDALVQLFVPDVRVGRDERGRGALAAWFSRTMRRMRTSIHVVANHVVDLDDADHARGVVTCHDELEWPDRGEWQQGKLQYWDTYRRVDGEWCFARRRFLRWYIVDALSRPEVGAGVGAGEDALSTEVLPDAFPTWGRFWEDPPGPSGGA